MFKPIAAGLACALVLAGCTTVRTTSPQRSAAQQLLISTAADRAAVALAAQIPAGLSAWLDTSALAAGERAGDIDATDRAYAVAAIRDALLSHGVRLVADAAGARAVIVPRAGALSTDERETLIGLPSLPAPVPIAAGGSMTIPALSLYRNTKARGVAKFAATVYEPASGKLIVSTDPAYGFSRQEDGVVLFVITWRSSDVGVDLSEDPPKPVAGGR